MRLRNALIVLGMLVWLVAVRIVLMPIAAPPPVSQAALIAGGAPTSLWEIAASVVAMAGIAVAFGMIVIPVMRRRVRRRGGRCTGCGYDLRAIATAHCPECGLAIADVETA